LLTRDMGVLGGPYITPMRDTGHHVSHGVFERERRSDLPFEAGPSNRLGVGMANAGVAHTGVADTDVADTGAAGAWPEVLHAPRVSPALKATGQNGQRRRLCSGLSPERRRKVRWP
jgi:hypothetical protein